MSADAHGGDLDGAARAIAAIAAEAARFLAAVTDRSAGQVVKPDGTFATAADHEAERLILARLADAFPEVPAVAEETCRQHGGSRRFFLVDPLDGTHDFLTGAGEYSVNIALVSGDRPVAAAIAAPSLDRVWAAGATASWSTLRHADDPGAWRPAKPGPADRDGLLALVSRRHGDVETERCLEGLAVADRRTVSSGAKFGLIASGEADVYVRCGPTMEWDTAAGDHILTQAGGCVVGPDGGPLTYGHAERGYRNGPFAAFGDPGQAGRVSLPARAIDPRRRVI